jgi:hypothetical protein
VVNAAYKATLVAGTDGSNYQILATDADGHVQIDVLSGGGAGEQYADGTAVSAEYKGNLILGTDGSNYQVISVDSSGNVQTELASALPAGTNAIGKLAANSGVDIGDVDILTLPVGHNIIDSGTVTAVTSITNVVHVDDNAGSLTVDGTVTANLSATDNAVLDTIDAVLDTINAKLVSGTDIGDVTINNAAGASAVNIQDGGNAITVDNAGTFAVQATCVGTVADDATTPGNPVMIGGKAVNTDGTDPTSVAENDVAILRTTPDRRLLVSDVSPRSGTALQEETSAQTNHEVVAAPGASLSLYITDVIVSNGATAGSIKFVESTASSPVTKIGTLYLGINGGAVMNFRTPIRCSANVNFGFTSTTMTTHTVTVNYYIAP